MEKQPEDLKNLKCPHCSKIIDWGNPIYSLSLNRDINNPVSQWEKDFAHSTYWSSKPYCSRECFESDIHSIVAELREFIDQEDLAAKLISKYFE